MFDHVTEYIVLANGFLKWIKAVNKRGRYSLPLAPPPSSRRRRYYDGGRNIIENTEKNRELNAKLSLNTMTALNPV